MNAVLIVAGGAGSRMGSDIPKQFIEIKGKALILWTLEKFRDFDSNINIVVVLPESHVNIWQRIIKNHPENQLITLANGGPSRYHSVINGLKHISESEIVGIHDAVRPLVSSDTIDRCYRMAAEKGSAIPVVDMEDSLRLIKGGENEILDRSIVKRIQTPQVFNTKRLLEAYEKCDGTQFTDDASVYESVFGEVQLVKGNQENIKITYPVDLQIAESLLGKTKS